MSFNSLSDFLTHHLNLIGFDDAGLIEYCLGILEEDSLELLDKQEAIQGILEIEDDDESKLNAIKSFLEESTEFIQQLEIRESKRLEEEELAKSAALLSLKSGGVQEPEDEASRRKALIQSYSYLEEDAPNKPGKAVEDGKPSIVMPDPNAPQSKKARKKAEIGVDILMRPNVNAAVVKGAELQRRQEDSAKAANKKEKDKNDLKKQKEDAIKKASDKTKKAAKGERRA